MQVCILLVPPGGRGSTGRAIIGVHPRSPTDVNPQEPAKPAPPKRLNSFQILGAVLSAAGGVRGVSKRGTSIADASTGAILGAILIFLALLGVGLYAFVHAIKSSVGG